jgi:hypothetical protein
MTLKAMPAFATTTIIGLGGQVEARTQCQEYLRLRNAATEAWKRAMKAGTFRCALSPFHLGDRKPAKIWRAPNVRADG